MEGKWKLWFWLDWDTYHAKRETTRNYEIVQKENQPSLEEGAEKIQKQFCKLTELYKYVRKRMRMKIYRRREF